MNSKFLSILFLFLLLFDSVSSQIITQNVEDRIKLFNAWVESRIEYKHWPGLIVGIVYDQELIWKETYGYADVENKTLLDETSLFPIASNSKMFTAIAIMKLRDEGKLNIDDSIEKYLPWFEKINDKNADSKKITIRHLLTHTAGIPREANFNSWSDGVFPDLNQLSEKLEFQEISFETDVRYKYSNLGTSLLGAIIANVSGMQYQNYIKENILDPLEMNNSGFNLETKQNTKFASGYSKLLPNGTRTKANRCDYKSYTSAAGVNSTFRDLVKFASWQFRIRNTNTSEIISGATLGEMQHVYWVDDSWEFGLGLGFFIYHKKPNDLIGHGGHDAGYCTDITIDPKDKIAVIVLANADDIDVYPDINGSVSNKIFSIIVPEVRKEISKNKKSQKPALSFNEYTGTYRNYWNDFRIINYQNNLVLLKPESKNPETMIVKLIPIEKNIFRAESDFTNRYEGEIVEFEEDKKGNITKMRMLSETWKKIRD